MFAEFDKVVRCLALELPEPVHADVVAKYGKLKAEVEKFTSTNTASQKLLASLHVAVLQSTMRYNYRRTMLYKDVCKQLSGVA